MLAYSLSYMDRLGLSHPRIPTPHFGEGKCAARQAVSTSALSRFAHRSQPEG